jgi:PAS domain S-box-containing protein
MNDEKKSQSQLLKEIKKLRNQNTRLEKVKQDQVCLIENLRENEKKYKNLFEHAADMIVVINPRGKIINLNSTFERESQYKKGEMLGKNIFTCGLLTKNSVVKIRSQLSALLQGKALPLIEIQGITKKGEIKHFELKAHLYKRSGIAFAIEAILRNISERKRVEEDLRESENKFRTIVENSHAGLCIIDSDFKITYLNDQFAQIFSIQREKLLNKDFRKFLDQT